MRLTFITLLLVLPLVAGASLAAADPESGGARYAACAVCHGSDGEGNATLKAPRLAHLAPVYIIAQLEKFKSGVRGGSGASSSAVQMAGMAATLPDDQAIQDVASFITTLQGPVSAATVAGDLLLGADYYNQFCGACHGARAQGNPALNSPRLAGADDWYLLGQLQAFREGSRGSHAGDRTGRQMRAMAAVLPDEQAVRDVVAFIRSLGQ